MITIEHYVANSGIHGLGLFAGQDVEKDEVIWRFVAGYDIVYSYDEFSALPDMAKQYVKAYGWFDRLDNLWHISVDGDKYTNHSDNPNTYMDDEGLIRASASIAKGTELTGDYREFDNDHYFKLHE